jgi:hypothetical protein
MPQLLNPDLRSQKSNHGTAVAGEERDSGETTMGGELSAAKKL